MIHVKSLRLLAVSNNTSKQYLEKLRKECRERLVGTEVSSASRGMGATSGAGGFAAAAAAAGAVTGAGARTGYGAGGSGNSAIRLKNIPRGCCCRLTAISKNPLPGPELRQSDNEGKVRL